MPNHDTLPPRKSIPSFWHPHDPARLDLHLGENPFPPTPRVLAAVEEAAHSLHRYPDTNALALRHALAEYAGHGVTPAQVMVGNGSDELIDLAVVAFTAPGQAVLSFDPTFFVYSFCARRHDREFVTLRRTDSFGLPPPHSELHKDAIGLTFIANPNNPTGTLEDRERLLAWLNHLPGMVVIDECYYEFSGETLLDALPHYPNLVIFRSLSKSFGLAGLRLGYALACAETVERLERHAMTFPVNCLAQAAGLSALQDRDAYLERIALLKQEREHLRAEMEAMGLVVLPSATNFLLVLFPVSTPSPAPQLAQEGILVSDQSSAMQQPAVRIAVGAPEENRRLLAVMQRRFAC